MLKEFREFALRGSVLDLAVGIIIGAAFGTVVNSFVNDILMPPIGLLLGGVDFANLFINLSGEQYESLAAAQEAGAATINYGLFLNAVISFLIIAFVIFLLIRQVNRLQKEEETPAEPTSKDCPFCFSSIAIQATRCPNCTSQLG
jgi:large conductance mechanosensitive channel